MKKIATIPTNLQECFDALSEILNEGEQDQLMMCSEKDMIKYHHGLGRFLRNEWGLWQDSALYKNLEKMGFLHPDDMSQTIIEAYRSSLRKEKFDLNSKIEEYKEYWDRLENEKGFTD